MDSRERPETVMERCTFKGNVPVPDARDVLQPSVEILQRLTPGEMPSKEVLGQPEPKPLSVQQLATPAFSPPAPAEKRKKEYPFLVFQKPPDRNKNGAMLPLPLLRRQKMPSSYKVDIPNAVLRKAISMKHKGPLSFRSSGASVWPDMSVFRYAEPAQWIKIAEHDSQLLEPPYATGTTFPTSNLRVRHGVAYRDFSALPLLLPHSGIWGPKDGNNWKKRRVAIRRSIEENERNSKLPLLRMKEVQRWKALYKGDVIWP